VSNRSLPSGVPRPRRRSGFMLPLVLMVLAEVDAKPIRAAVSERQWKGLAPMLNQGRAMRSAIEAQGFLEKAR